MKYFELVKEYTYPSGSVYVLYNKEKNFFPPKQGRVKKLSFFHTPFYLIIYR